MSILPPCSIVTLLRYVSIELKELLTNLLTYLLTNINSLHTYARRTHTHTHTHTTCAAPPSVIAGQYATSEL